MAFFMEIFLIPSQKNSQKPQNLPAKSAVHHTVSEMCCDPPAEISGGFLLSDYFPYKS